MEVNVITHAEGGELKSEKQDIKGIAFSELKVDEKWREFKGKLVERKEKEIQLKDGKKLYQYIYNDAPDERGTQLNLETFSPTDDAILAKIMDDKTADVHMYYEMVSDNFGTKFKIKAIELPDGTWTAPKAKEAWKKGNIVNNRALAVQSASYLLMGSATIGEGNNNEKITDEVLVMAEKLYEWINKA